MTNKKAAKIICSRNCTYNSKDCEKGCKTFKDVLRMAQWKDEQFKEQLSNLKDEIQSNLCASSGFNDEYSRGYQDCGMKVMEMIDKILEV